MTITVKRPGGGYRLLQPGDDQDFAFIWTDFLDESGSPDDHIATSTWYVRPDEGSPGCETHDDDIGVASGVEKTTVFIRNATRGRIYELINVVTTDMGRTEQMSVTFRCEGESV